MAQNTLLSATATLLKSNVTEIPKPPKNLIAKLAEACNAVGGVEKKGRNDFQRYDYVKAADVAKAIRHELFQRGIVVIIDEKEWTQLRTVKTTAGELPEMPAEMKRVVDRKIREQRGICPACSLAMEDYSDVEPDHIRPKGMDGARADDRSENIRAVHGWCNREKGSKRIA